MLLSVFEVLLKLFVEIGEGVGPLLLTVFDFVEFFFQASGVGHVENIAEVFHQKIGHDQSDFRRRKLPAQLGDVLALLNRGQDGGVGGRTADAAFFQFLHQRRFVVARRRLGEVLLRVDFAQRQFLTRLERRQLVF